MLDWLTGSSDDDSSSNQSPGEDLLGDADWDDEGGMADDIGFDGMDADDGEDVGELAHDVEVLEEELGSMSSTVNSLEHENQEISEDLEDIKDNVRKLLEIYEMVTSGVNPFEENAPIQTGSGDGTFGLFGDEQEPAEGAQEPVVDDEWDDEEQTDDGRSFSDLQEDYDSDIDDAGDDEDLEDDSEFVEDDTFDPEPRHQPTAGAEPSGSAVLGEKPYLRRLPDGYASDLLVMRWLSELQENVVSSSVSNTIEYYAEIGWISDGVAAELHGFVPGMANIESVEDPVAVSSLPFDDHRRSLWYIHKLASATPQRVVMTDAPVDLEDVLSIDTGALDGYDGPQAARTDGGAERLGRIDRIESQGPTDQERHR